MLNAYDLNYWITFVQLDETVSDMESLYGKATIPEYGDNNSNRTLSLEPGISHY